MRPDSHEEFYCIIKRLISYFDNATTLQLRNFPNQPDKNKTQQISFKKENER